MRMFPVYAPKLIVKHARIFLCGVVWVKDLGRLEFDRGRFLLPKKIILNPSGGSVVVMILLLIMALMRTVSIGIALPKMLAMLFQKSSMDF